MIRAIIRAILEIDAALLWLCKAACLGSVWLAGWIAGVASYPFRRRRA